MPSVELEAIRLASALVHAVPGAELRLTCAAGVDVVVSRHPAADLTPCAMRQVVIDARRRSAATLGGSVSRIVELAVGGSMEEFGGGVVRSRTPCGAEQRWLATTLPWELVADLLRELPCPDAMHATVRPDDALAVTLVGVSTTTADLVPQLDRLGASLAAQLLVEELLASVHAAGDAQAIGPDTDR